MIRAITKRFDPHALYLALALRREVLGISWREAARQMRVGVSTLSRLQLGKRPDIDTYLAAVEWLGQTAPTVPQPPQQDLVLAVQRFMGQVEALARRVELLERGTQEGNGA